MKKPIIGILLDFETRKTSEGGYSDFPWYAIRTHYDLAIYNNGGIPLFIPYHSSLINEYLKICDGLLFPGGEFDIDPSYYGESPKPETRISTNRRTIFEMELMKKALECNKPILAICAGQQLLNVLLGGTLYQDVSKSLNTSIEHKHQYSQEMNWHDVEIKNNTKLAMIVKVKNYKINSHHHQAVNKLGKNLIINAVAPDGVIEGIEHVDKKFCIGLEWHPEYEKNVEDSKIFKAFINAST